MTHAPVDAPTVLVVDDDAAVCWSVRDALAGAGAYQVVTAPSAGAARGLVAKRRIDLVLTDVRMPGESGLSLLSWLRRERAGIPVVVMTAYGGAEAARIAIANGAANLIPKPIDLEVLLDVVQRVLPAA